MNDKIQIFANNELNGKIRIVEIENIIYFVGKDVAEILDYSNTGKAVLAHVDEDDRIKIDTKTHSHFGNELGQRGGWLINESGLYSLILSSKKPNAKKFKRWITNEVLPSIRKHGAYIAPKKMKELEENPNKVKELCDVLKAEYTKNKELRKELEEKNAIIAKQEEEISDLSLAERYLNEEEMDIHLSTDASAYRFMNNEYIAEVVLTKLRKLMQDNKSLQEENEKLKETVKADLTTTSKDVISIEEHIKIIKKLLQSTDNRK